MTFFEQETNREIIQKLRRAGVRLEEAGKPQEMPLRGQEFVITGKLSSFTRAGAEAVIRGLGGVVGSSVTRKTTYLVTGADPGSKLRKAQALGISVLNEDEFLLLLRA